MGLAKIAIVDFKPGAEFFLKCLLKKLMFQSNFINREERTASLVFLVL